MRKVGSACKSAVFARAIGFTHPTGYAASICSTRRNPFPVAVPGIGVPDGDVAATLSVAMSPLRRRACGCANPGPARTCAYFGHSLQSGILAGSTLRTPPDGSGDEVLCG